MPEYHNTEWLIDTKHNPRSNEIIGKALEEMGVYAEAEGRVCAGKKRSVWPTTNWEVVCGFVEAAKAEGSPHEVFFRKLPGGKIYKWKLGFRGKFRKKKGGPHVSTKIPLVP